jgi:hypothetical protein
MRHLNPRHQVLANALSDTQAISGRATDLALRYNPTISKGKVHRSFGGGASMSSVTPSMGQGVGSPSIADLTFRLQKGGTVPNVPGPTISATLQSLMPKVKTGQISGAGVAAAMNSTAAAVLAQCLEELKNATKWDRGSLKNAEAQIQAQLKQLKLKSKRRAILEKQIEALAQLNAQESLGASQAELAQVNAEIANDKGVLVTLLASLVSRLQNPKLIDCLLQIAESEGALEAHAEYDQTSAADAFATDNGDVLVAQTEAGAMIEEAAPTIRDDGQSVPTGAQPSKDLIKGIPNMYLGIGALAVIGFLALRR